MASSQVNVSYGLPAYLSDPLAGTDSAGRCAARQPVHESSVDSAEYAAGLLLDKKPSV